MRAYFYKHGIKKSSSLFNYQCNVCRSSSLFNYQCNICPSRKSLLKFNEEISVLLATLMKTNQRVMLIGEFNINQLKVHENEQTQIFLKHFDCIYYCSGYQLPNQSIIIADNTPTLIDRP